MAVGVLGLKVDEKLVAYVVARISLPYNPLYMYLLIIVILCFESRLSSGRVNRQGFSVWIFTALCSYNSTINLQSKSCDVSIIIVRIGSRDVQ